jgi:hypothetical protein
MLHFCKLFDSTCQFFKHVIFCSFDNSFAALNIIIMCSLYDVWWKFVLHQRQVFIFVQGKEFFSHTFGASFQSPSVILQPFFTKRSNTGILFLFKIEICKGYKALFFASRVKSKRWPKLTSLNSRGSLLFLGCLLSASTNRLKLCWNWGFNPGEIGWFFCGTSTGP